MRLIIILFFLVFSSNIGFFAQEPGPDSEGVLSEKENLIIEIANNKAFPGGVLEDDLSVQTAENNGKPKLSYEKKSKKKKNKNKTRSVYQ